MLIFEKDVPGWIRKYCKQYEKLFGLDLWEIHIAMSDYPGHVDEETLGAANTNARYRQSWVEYRTNLQDLEHVRTGRLRHAVLFIINNFVPEKSRTIALEAYTDANEATIELFTRSYRVYTQRDADLKSPVDKKKPPRKRNVDTKQLRLS